jgi:hypothetical protein
MRVHHVAALALVGWYLMVPPGPLDHRRFDAPLWQWPMLRGFDSASECRACQRWFEADAKKKVEAGKKEIDAAKSVDEVERIKPDALRKADIADTENALLCIASDDPRVKK